jgi:hypothetical protein
MRKQKTTDGKPYGFRRRILIARGHIVQEDTLQIGAAATIIRNSASVPHPEYHNLNGLLTTWLAC